MAEGYLARISGPLLDRIDIQIAVPAVRAIDLIRPAAKEGSAAVAARVARARPASASASASRPMPYGPMPRPMALLETIATPDAVGMLLSRRRPSSSMKLSARGFHRVLRVARTLADLDGRDRITRLNIPCYRQRH